MPNHLHSANSAKAHPTAVSKPLLRIGLATSALLLCAGLAQAAEYRVVIAFKPTVGAATSTSLQGQAVQTQQSVAIDPSTQLQNRLRSLRSPFVFEAVKLSSNSLSTTKPSNANPSNATAGVSQASVAWVRAFTPQAAVIVVQTSMTESETLRTLAADPSVQSVAIDRPVRVQATSPLPALLAGLDEAKRNRSWFHQALSSQVASINSGALWANYHGSSPSVVAVLDTGVLPDHPMLQGHLLPGYDFVSNARVANDGQSSNGSERDADPTDPGDGASTTEALSNPVCLGPAPSTWHGTFVSGLVAGNPIVNEGIFGVHWNASVLPVRVLGRCGGFSTDLADGMRWAAGLPVVGVPNNPFPAKVINVSLGIMGACAGAIEGAAVNAARQAGSLVVAASGNGGSLNVDSPANCPGAFAVTAINHEGLKPEYANIGSSVQLAAPGGNGTLPMWGASNTGTLAKGNNSYASKAGTSFAAPLVAATASLYWQIRPTASVAEVENTLKQNARPFVNVPNRLACQANVSNNTSNNASCICTTALCGVGMLDLAATLQSATQGRSYTNLFTNEGLFLPPGATRTVFASGSTNSLGQEVTAVSFRLANVLKSTADTPDPVLSSAGLSATVSAPAGVLGFNVVADVANGQSSALSLTVGRNTVATPGVLASLVQALQGKNTGSTLLNTPPVAQNTAPGSTVISTSTGGGGGGGLSLLGLLTLVGLLVGYRQSRVGSIPKHC